MASAAPESEAVAPPFERSRLREGALWVLLLGATSPVLVDLVRHLTAEPWALYSLVFWVLFARELARRPEERRPQRSGYALLALAFALELAMLRAGWPRMARPAVALAAIGLARALGHPRPALALTALWAVPIPNAIVEFGSPDLERAIFAGVSATLRRAGVEAELAIGAARALAVRTAAGSLPLEPADGGLPLAALLGGLGWYAGARRGLSPVRLVASAAGHALLAAPLQVAGALAGVLVCAGGWPRAGRVLLSAGPALAGLASVAILALRRRPAAAKSSASSLE